MSSRDGFEGLPNRLGSAGKVSCMVLSVRDSQGKVSQVEAFPGPGFSSQGISESKNIELGLLAGSQGAVPETEEERQGKRSSVKCLQGAIYSGGT